jgi:hypothetical protein
VAEVRAGEVAVAVAVQEVVAAVQLEAGAREVAAQLEAGVRAAGRPQVEEAVAE